MKHPYYRFFNYLLIVYIALILYASLYPISYFSPNGLNIFSFWNDKTPIYLSRFDIWLNVLGYIPLGCLLVWRFYQKMDHLWAILLAVICASLLSFSTEALQTYIITRVASKLDWYTNTLGAFMGASIGIIFSPLLVRDWPIIKSYRRNFSNKHPFGLFLMILWFLSMLAPQPYWFSLGFWQITGAGISNAANFSSDAQYIQAAYRFFSLDFLLYFKNYMPEQFLTLYDDIWPWVMFCCLSGMGLASTLHIQKERAPKTWFILPLLMVFVIRSVFFMLEHQTFLIPMKVLEVLAYSLIFMWFMSFWSLLLRGFSAILMILVGLTLSNLLPINSFYYQSLKLSNSGAYAHIFGLFKWIYLLLPFLALFWSVWMLLKYVQFIYQAKKNFRVKYYKNA